MAPSILMAPTLVPVIVTGAGAAAAALLVTGAGAAGAGVWAAAETAARTAAARNRREELRMDSVKLIWIRCTPWNVPVRACALRTRFRNKLRFHLGFLLRSTLGRTA